ncbi:MAG TPA: SDR family oxidoreductase [Nannocystis exedens]|nr:SDR family oxidoreductase [Nannocystis exedens]
MVGKVVLITGGNAGIGRETAVALARSGARVLFTSRDPARGQVALAEVRERSGSAEVELVVLDLASLASVRACADEVRRRCSQIDVLINNAGLILSERCESEDGIEMTLAVNHFGPFALTLMLLDRVRESEGGRIVNVSSDAHRMVRAFDFDDLHSRKSYSAMKAYSQSKLANILFTRELAARIDGFGITANALHPGLVRSHFARDGDVRGLLGAVFAVATRVVAISPKAGARTSVYLASSPEVQSTSGEYFVRCRSRRPNAAARDPAAAHRLWQLSEELSGQSIDV